MSIYAIMQEIYIFRFQHCLKDSIQMKDLGLKKIEFKVLIKCTFVVTKFHDKDVILQWLWCQNLLPVVARLFLVNVLKNINWILFANFAFVNLTQSLSKSLLPICAFLLVRRILLLNLENNKIWWTEFVPGFPLFSNLFEVLACHKRNISFRNQRPKDLFTLNKRFSFSTSSVQLRR